MKILHVLYSGLGGHGNVFFSFVKGDGSQQFQYEAVFNGVEEVKQEYIDNCARYNIPWSFVRKTPGLDIGYYRNLVKTMRHSDAAIIFLHSSSYILPARLSNIFNKKKKRIVVRETQANHLKAKMEWWWLTVAMLMAHRVVFLSEAYRLEIKKKLSWVYRSRKIAVIPNGLDLQQYQPVHKPFTGTIVIGMQSRLVHLKDHLTLLGAFALLLRSATVKDKNIILNIAGDGGYRKVLEQRTSALKLNDSVLFTGMLPERELLGFLWSLDIYVHASLGETMSTAIMQAMACGLPVIASDVKGIQNMLSNEYNGLLVPVKDAGAMCTAIERLINDTGLRTTIAANGRKYATTNFSNERMVKAYLDLFEGIKKI